MKRNMILAGAIAVVLASALSATVAYRFGMSHAASGAAPVADKTDPANGRKVLYWHDPMVPGQKFDKPGKSPFMDMPLVPVYADAGADAGGVAVSGRQVQNLGLRTVAAEQGSLQAKLEVSGSVGWNERGLVVVQARNTGYVEKLYVRATLDHVSRGQPLADIYVPDWVAAQEEYLALRHMQGEGVTTLVDAARARMRQAGMPEALIAQVAHSGKVLARTTITAPQAGSVLELAAREGMTVSAGATLFRINSLDSVWVTAEVPEGQAGWLRPGATVEAHAPAFPDQVFHGRVQTLLPEVDAATRTLKARIELANPGGRLSPGMFVRVALATGARPSLLIPSEALIRTGERSVVMIDDGEGKYHPAEVQTGQEADGRIEVLKGLQAGQKVVISGQFLLDSEANLRAVGTRTTPAASAPKSYEVVAVFESLDGDLAMLSHPPIPELKWGVMTMGFTVPKSGWPKGIQAGQKVHVAFELGADGQPVLTHVMPVDAQGAHK